MPALLLVASAALGFADPRLALPAALAVFFFTTGYALLSIARIELPVPAKVGVSIVASVLASTHFASLAANLFGYSPMLVSACTAALALLAFAIDFRRLASDMTALASDRTIVALALAAFAFVGGVLYLSTWREVPGGFVNGGWNWSDFLLHYSISSSIAAGNFPPQTPYFAGTPLVYHYFADLHAALFSTVSGAGLVRTIVFSQALLAMAFALVAFSVALFFLRSRRAAAIAVILLLFGGGLGYLEFFDGLSEGKNAIDMLSRRSFDNDWNSPVFKVPSVLGVGLLAHRATTVALPAFAAVMLLIGLAFEERSGRKALLAGLLAALLPPFHFFALPIAALAVGLFLLSKLAENSRNAKPVFKYGFFFALPMVLAIPFIITPLTRAGAANTIRLHWGWESGAHDLPSLAYFYALNFGVPLLVAVAGLAFSWLGGRHFASSKRFRAKVSSIGAKVTGFFAGLSPQVTDSRFLWVSAAALFAVPNVFALTAIPWDTGKFFQFMWLPVCILAAAFLARFPKPVIVVAVAASVLAPLLLSAWFVLGSPMALSSADFEVAGWISGHTTIKDVFVTEAFINQPTDYAGRLRLLTFTPYVANNGYDPSGRERAVKEIYCSGDAAKSALLMADNGADYVIVRRWGECMQAASKAFSGSAYFESVFANEGSEIFRLR